MKLNTLRVKELIAEQQRTISDVAKAVKITPTNLSKVIKRGDCQLRTAGRIASALGVKVKDIWIMEGENDEKSRS